MTISLSDRHRYRQIILSHSKNPRHFGRANPVHLHHKSTNPYCGDTVEITITLDEETQTITDLKFQGSGCALCLASADLMIETVKGKSIADVLEIVEQFHRVMLGQAELTPSLYKLKAVEGAKRYPVKIKCTTLAWHTLKAAIFDISSLIIKF